MKSNDINWNSDIFFAFFRVWVSLKVIGKWLDVIQLETEIFHSLCSAIFLIFNHSNGEKTYSNWVLTKKVPFIGPSTALSSEKINPFGYSMHGSGSNFITELIYFGLRRPWKFAPTHDTHNVNVNINIEQPLIMFDVASSFKGLN